MVNKIAYISLSAKGAGIARILMDKYPGDLYLHESAVGGRGTDLTREFSSVIELTGEIFKNYPALVYIMPTGVVVRAIAGEIASKYSDPAVVVIDVVGRNVISLLSGHEGGANKLAYNLANVIGAEPVVTTTTEAEKTLIAGVGCRRGVSELQVRSALEAAVAEAGYKISDLRLIATAQIKADEDGLIKAAQNMSLPLRIIAHSAIIDCGYEFERSEFVENKTGLPAVAEPCALLGGARCRLIQKKMVRDGVTVALALECCGLSE